MRSVLHSSNYVDRVDRVGCKTYEEAAEHLGKRAHEGREQDCVLPLQAR